MIFFDIECQHMDERRTMNDEYIAAGDDSRPVNSDFATKHFTGFPQRAALWDGPYEKKACCMCDKPFFKMFSQ